MGDSKKDYARSSSKVEGYYRNGTWVKPHKRKATIVKKKVDLPKGKKYIDSSYNNQYDKYGFDSFNYHRETHSRFDINGFDVNGIHKDTNNKYNLYGIDRNGNTKNSELLEDFVEITETDFLNNKIDEFLSFYSPNELPFEIKKIIQDIRNRINSIKLKS